MQNRNASAACELSIYGFLVQNSFDKENLSWVQLIKTLETFSNTKLSESSLKG